MRLWLSKLGGDKLRYVRWRNLSPLLIAIELTRDATGTRSPRSPTVFLTLIPRGIEYASLSPSPPLFPES